MYHHPIDKQPGIASPPMVEVPKLTVVIPLYNQSGTLSRSVASVLAGDMKSVEIIIVDDGSTDGAEPILAGLERLLSSVHVIRCQQNSGAPATLNVGLEQVRTPYVSFLGADDFVMPNLYGTMISVLDRNPSAAFSCGEIAIVGNDDAIRGIRPVTVPSFREEFLSPEVVRRRIRHTDNWICNTAAVYRTAMIRAVGGYDVRLGAFCDGFLSRLLAFVHGFVFVPGVSGVCHVAASTLSASSILDPNERTRMARLAQSRLMSSPIGSAAPEYPETYARRLRFSAARMQLVWNGAKADPALVTQAAGGTEVDGRALAWIWRWVGFGSLGRIMVLTWLALRLRPAAPASMMVHLVRNRVVLLRNRRRIKDATAALEIARAELMRATQTAN